MNRKSTFDLNWAQIQTALNERIKTWNETQDTSKNPILADDQSRNNVSLTPIQASALLIILSARTSDQARSTERSKDRENWILFKNYDFARDEMSQPHIILNDYFVLLIILNFKGDARFYFWSANFLFKNLIDYRFLETERAIKVWNEDRQRWKYVIIDDVELHDEKNATKYAKIVDIRNAFQIITSRKDADVQKNVIDTKNHELTKARLQMSVQWWNRKKNEKIAKTVAIFFDFATRATTKKRLEMKSAFSKSIKKQKRVLKKNKNDEATSTEVKEKNKRKKKLLKSYSERQRSTSTQIKNESDRQKGAPIHTENEVISSKTEATKKQKKAIQKQMQMIKKRQKEVSKTDEKKSTILKATVSEAASVENFFTIHKETWAKLSSEKRKRICLESQLKENVIETNPQFAVMKQRAQKRKNIKKIERNQKRENTTNSKQILRISRRRKIVDSNMNFMNEDIFQKRFQIMNDEFFFSSLRSLSSVSINFYEKVSSNVDALNLSKSNSESTSNIEALNSLNFFELNFQLNLQSISNRRDVLIFRFWIFSRRINSTQNIQSPSFKSSFDINRRRAGLKSIASKNIFTRSQNSFSRLSFFFQSLFSRSSFFDRKSLIASLNTKIKTLFSTASFNSTVKTAFFAASVNSKIIMPTNLLRRRQLIKIEVFEKNEQTDIKNLYKKKLFDILSIINDVRDQISSSVLRKINKIVKNLKKKKTAMNETKKKENKTKKNENKIIKVWEIFQKNFFTSNFEGLIFEDEKCWNLTSQLQNFLFFSWSRTRRKGHEKAFS